MTKFTAGFARLDTTPPLGVPMGGSWNARTGKGVLDPLFVNAVAFGDGEKSAVLLVLDIGSMGSAIGERWPKEIAKRIGLPAEAVIVCCTHTHTFGSLGKDELYDQWMLRRLCDAATLALNDRKTVTDLRWAEGNAPGLTFVRRWKLSDGTVMTNPPASMREMIVEPACSCDDSIRVVQILRADAPQIILGNFQSHPDNIGGEYYSADFPGAFRNRVEALVEESRCVFLNGCEGQMVIADRRLPKEPASHQKATTHGNKLAQVAVSLLEKTVSAAMTGLSFGQLAVRLKTKRDPARVPECQRIVELRAQGRDLEFAPTKKQANYIYAEAKRIIALEEQKLDYRDTAVSAIAFCGLVLVGLPGEPFNEIGVQVCGNSKYPVTCLLCNANGCYGYFPTAEGYDQGGYEPYATPYSKGVAENLADTADKLVASL